MVKMTFVQLLAQLAADAPGSGVYYGIMGIYYMGIMEKKMEAMIMGYIMGI